MNGQGPRRDTASESKRRVRFLALLLPASLGVYVVYLFGLQVINGPTYKERADEVVRRVVPIHAQRGVIYDRNYDEPLATSRPSFAVDIVPAELGNADESDVVTRLAGVLSVSPEEISSHIPPDFRSLYQPVEILNGVPYETIVYLAEHLNAFPGVSWHSKPIRSYLTAGSMAHILGYVGDITPEELQVLYNQGYDANSTVGKSGIEKQYDRVLRGRDGRTLRTVDVNGRSIDARGIDEVPPENGKNIVLTIDRSIQTLAERALGERMGSVVVLKPASGEVLALVSYPFFDPNLFVSHVGASSMRDLFLDSRFPFVNRAIQSAYAPASTFKVIMTAADIEENALPPGRTIDCTGRIEFGGRVFTDWKPSGHGPLNLGDALAESCDVYFWTLGRKYLGIQRMLEYSQRFGLGQPTGIDLPGEVAGLVPSPEWKERTYHQLWLGGDTMNMSIGQGNLLVTPLQMADVVAAVVNDGVIYVPHVVKEIRDPTTGRVVERTEPRVLGRTGMRASTFEGVSRAMRGVVTHGTANVVITTEAVQVAGKTGTGEVGMKDHFTSWFAAFGPYDAPNAGDKVVVVVMVEATNPWEWWAPKAASIIFQGIFAHETYEQAVHSLEPAWYLDPAVVGDSDR